MATDAEPGATPAEEPGDTATPARDATGAPTRGSAEQERQAEARGPYTVVLSRQVRRNLHENLPTEVAIAATETITNAIAVNPYRVGKPLNEPLDGYYSARRGTLPHHLPHRRTQARGRDPLNPAPPRRLPSLNTPHTVPARIPARRSCTARSASGQPCAHNAG